MYVIDKSHEKIQTSYHNKTTVDYEDDCGQKQWSKSDGLWR